MCVCVWDFWSLSLCFFFGVNFGQTKGRQCGIACRTRHLYMSRVFLKRPATLQRRGNSAESLVKSLASSVSACVSVASPDIRMETPGSKRPAGVQSGEANAEASSQTLISSASAYVSGASADLAWNNERAFTDVRQSKGCPDWLSAPAMNFYPSLKRLQLALSTLLPSSKNKANRD